MIASSADDNTSQRHIARLELRQYYEALLHSIGWPRAEATSFPRILGITSCRSGEGVSTVAAHLAATAASSGRHRVLLADANFARPGMPRIFGVPGRPGLIEATQGTADWREIVQTATVPHLSLLAAGRLADRSPSRLAADPSLHTLLEELSNHFALIVVDLPAVGHSTDTLRLSAACHGILLVVEAERIRRELAQRVTRLLCQAGATPRGVVLNKYSQHAASWTNIID